MSRRRAVVVVFEGPQVALYGARAAERYDDGVLAGLAEVTDLEHCRLYRQHLTHVPPMRPQVARLVISDSPSMVSLAGIEKIVGLNQLELAKLPNLDLGAELARLVELPELVELDLVDVQLRALPDVFAQLPSLAHLRLVRVPDLELRSALAILGRVTTLRSLWIEPAGNVPDAFAPLQQLQMLALESIAEIPPSVYALGALECLTLTNARTPTLDEALARLPRLRELHIGNSAIAALPDAICDCATLEVISAAKSRLATLPADLGRLAKLRVLDVGDTAVKVIPDSIGDLAALRVLVIPSKRCTVPESLFGLSLDRFWGPDEARARIVLRVPDEPETDHVRVFDPDRIPASFGDPRTLDVRLGGLAGDLPQLGKLARVATISLELEDLASALGYLASARFLRTLTIDGEHERYPDALGNLVGLTKLVLRSRPSTSPDAHGSLVELTPAIGRLVNLVELELGSSRLVDLPAAIGELIALEKLVIDGPHLVQLPVCLGRLPRLAAMHLKYMTALEGLPPELARCPALATFSIWRSRLQVPELLGLGAWPALRDVALDDVDLSHPSEVDALLRSLARVPLERLKLGQGLAELPASIGALATLRVLDLSYSSIEQLPAALAACTALRWIGIPRQAHETTKAKLPPGRWRKGERSRHYWFERTD